MKYISKPEELIETLKSHKKVIIKFEAKYNRYGDMIQEMFEDLDDEHDDIHFFRVDINESPKVNQLAKVTQMPTIRYYLNGKAVDEFVGIDPNQIRERAEKLNAM